MMIMRYPAAPTTAGVSEASKQFNVEVAGIALSIYLLHLSIKARLCHRNLFINDLLSNA